MSHNCLRILVVLVWGLSIARGAPIPKSCSEDLESLVGEKLERSGTNVRWEAGPLTNTNAAIYSVLPPVLHEGLLKRLASEFGVRGEIEQIPSDKITGIGSIGFWIKEVNPTNSFLYRTVYAHLTTGLIGYASGDDGSRYNFALKKPVPVGVPNKEEALALTLQLLPMLNLSTNDLEHRKNGKVTWGSGESGVSYTDRADKQRKRVVIARHITLYQRIPEGGLSAGIGDGGALRVSFVSDRKIASIELFFRKLAKAGSAPGKSVQAITKSVERGEAWSWDQNIPRSLIVKNWSLAYPQGNSQHLQEYLCPFYALSCIALNDRKVTLYVPLE
jgi:hypothetical protein